MTSSVITVEGLGKQFRLGQMPQAYGTLREAVMGLFKRTDAPRTGTRPTVWALRDVSFSVDQGEVVGIIGPNGAGKSTLLKILTRVMTPTVGSARMRGRVGSLLEVGTGFHPELTGRENVFLSGAILGMSTAEVRAKLDQIVDFAGVEAFLDTPVKRYSSGMAVRLGFAVAAHLEPEILLVDEVLAVGDVEFQRKCLGRMAEVSQSGRTILFVSHNMASISQLCGRCVLLEQGEISMDAAPAEAIRQYLSAGLQNSLLTKFNDHIGKIHEIELCQTQILTDGIIDTALPLDVFIRFSCPPYTNCNVTACLTTGEGVAITESSVADQLGRFIRDDDGSTLRLTVPERLLRPGVFQIRVWLDDRFGQGFDAQKSNPFQVAELSRSNRISTLRKSPRGMVSLPMNWSLVDKGKTEK